MKKQLILLLTLAITSSCVLAAEQTPTKADFDKKAKMQAVRAEREAAFEKRLGLTEAQKAQAKEIRMQGFEKLKPVIDEIRAKKQEAQAVKMSRIAVQAQEEKLAVIDAELKALHKKAFDIRKQNMKEFESILTRSQKKILKEMKKEGRQRYQANHQGQRPPMLPPVEHPVKK